MKMGSGRWGRAGVVAVGSVILVALLSGCPPVDEREPMTPPAPEHDPLPSPPR